MDVLAALLPPVVVGGAFIAIIVAVKRRADRESRDEDAYLDSQERLQQPPE
jgi:hypothetical protein